MFKSQMEKRTDIHPTNLEQFDGLGIDDAVKSTMNSRSDVEDTFDIENMFSAYLQLIKIDARKIAPLRLKDMRDSFYGGLSHLLILNQIVFGGDKKYDVTSDEIMQRVIIQCNDYFAKKLNLSPHAPKKSN